MKASWARKQENIFLDLASQYLQGLGRHRSLWHMVQRRIAHVNNSVHSSFLVVRVFPLWPLENFKNPFWIEWIESCIRPARLNIPRIDCDSACTAVQIHKVL